MADVAGMHDDELLVETAATRPCVRLLPWREALRVDPVRDHPHALRWRARLLQSQAHRVANRDDAVSTSKVERDETAQHARCDGILEPLQLHGDLGKDVLADHDERGAVA